MFVGAACAFGALARSELILFVPLLVVPLACLTRDRAWPVRLRWLGASVLAAVVVLAPWTIYNMTRFVHPVLLSAQFAPLLASANCESTYYGALQGYFDIRCAAAIDRKDHLTLKDDESQEDIVYQREAVAYVRTHLSRLPVVETVRLRRIVGLYRTSLYVRADALIEGRSPVWISWAALYSFWALSLLAVPGVFVLRRRKTPMFPLVAPVVVVVVTVLVTYASTRFRTTAEPALVVAAAAAIDAAISTIVVRRRSGRTGRADVCR